MMSRRAKSLWALACVCLCVGLMSAAPAQAQYRKGHFDVGGGITSPVSKLTDYTDAGWNIRFGAGYNASRAFNLGIHYDYNGLDTDSSVYKEALFDSVPGLAVNVHYWSIGLNGTYAIRQENEFFATLLGGIGYYQRTVELTTPSAIYIPPYWDPWWGWVGGGWTTGEQILARDSQDGFGVDVGVGLNLKIEAGSVFFVEARYQHAWMDGVDIDAIPVTFGIRW